MVYDLTMLKTFYAAYSEKIERVRNVLRRPMTLAEKILYAHLYDGDKVKNYKTFAVSCRNRYNLYIRIYFPCPFHTRLHIKIKIRQYIYLIYQKDIADGKHQRIFQRLILPFRYTQNHGIPGCARIEFRRTYQIAHVFQNSKLHVARCKAVQALARHIRVQMAHTARVQLNGFNARRRNGTRVHIGVDVRLHHTDLEFVTQTLDGARQGGRFAGAGRAHQVEQKDPLFFQLPAQKLGALVVVGEYALFDLQNPHFVHRYLSLVCLIAWLYQSSSIV